MRKGQIVKCVKVEKGAEYFFTTGKNYTITRGEGDVDHYGDTIKTRDFVVNDDNGEPTYCLICGDSFCEWELVSE